jgi:hypothetical protein
VGCEQGLAGTASQRRKPGTFSANSAGMSLAPVFEPSVVQLC